MKPTASPTAFRLRPDGTPYRVAPDGTAVVVETLTDHARLAALTDAQIEEWAITDPDHPGLDDAFWADFDARKPEKEPISIKLDRDILQFFRSQGRGYQTRINAVLRYYVEQQKKTAG
jgi:uncharacterized protein (DUF4415 family)